MKIIMNKKGYVTITQLHGSILDSILTNAALNCYANLNKDYGHAHMEKYHTDKLDLIQAFQEKLKKANKKAGF